MKDLLHQVCSENASIAGRAYQDGALGHGDVKALPEWPFVLYRELGVVPYQEVQKTARSGRHDYLVYVYDERGSYKRIDAILRELRDAFFIREGTRAPSGAQVTGVEWFGTSGDLVSKELNSNTKYATIRITANL